MSKHSRSWIVALAFVAVSFVARAEVGEVGQCREVGESSPFLFNALGQHSTCQSLSLNAQLFASVLASSVAMTGALRSTGELSWGESFGQVGAGTGVALLPSLAFALFNPVLLFVGPSGPPSESGYVAVLAAAAGLAGAILAPPLTAAVTFAVSRGQGFSGSSYFGGLLFGLVAEVLWIAVDATMHQALGKRFSSFAPLWAGLAPGLVAGSAALGQRWLGTPSRP